MAGPKRLFIIYDMSYKPVKVLLNQEPKLAKGFIRLGNDVRLFSYSSALLQLSPLKSKTFSIRFYKSRVDELLATQIRNYDPEVVYLAFVRGLDDDTIERMRQAAPNAVFIGADGDSWPQLQRNRVETAKKLDILTATNDGEFLQVYRDAGVPLCIFMPNLCDPDIDHRYEVSQQWRTDILWTGQIRHNLKRFPGEDMRFQLISRLAGMKNCTIYGCCGQPDIGGLNYLYAISGARIGVSINADNNIRLYHSDRLTHYLSCGTFVLAKRVPDSELLFKDGIHLRYFDTVEEFFDLANWYLNHENERIKIADAGMRHAHTEFNCEKIAKYILDLTETGTYNAPWM